MVINTDIEKMNRQELLAAVKRGLAREDAMTEWISSELFKVGAPQTSINQDAKEPNPQKADEIAQLNAALAEFKSGQLVLQKDNISLQQRNAKRITLVAKLKAQITELQALKFPPAAE